MLLSPDEIEKAVEIIQKGGIIAYPTETFYGLGTNALNAKAVERLFKIKKRPYTKPIPILIPHLDWLKKLTLSIPPLAEKLIARYWPGPLTIVFAATDLLPKNLTASTGKIAIRISSHPLAQGLVEALDLPLTATSANLSQMPPPTCPDELHAEIKAEVDAILDGGKTKGGLASTIIDVTVNPPQILREGVIKLKLPPLS